MRFLKHFLLLEKSRFFESTFYFLHKWERVKLSIITKKEHGKADHFEVCFSKILEKLEKWSYIYGITHPIFRNP